MNALPSEAEETRAFIRESVRSLVQKECDEWRCLRMGPGERVIPQQRCSTRSPRSAGTASASPRTTAAPAAPASTCSCCREELGRGSTDLVAGFSLTASGLRTLVANGIREQRDRLMPALMDGTHAAVDRRDGAGGRAPTRQPSRPRPAASATRTSCAARRRSARRRGFPTPSSSCTCAPIPTPRSSAGSACCCWIRRPPGVTLRRLPTIGRNITGVYEVFLDDVEVPAENLVGAENNGWSVLGAELPLERLIISAGFVGATFQVLDDTLRHVKEREQFGRPIGSFQAVAHLLVDLYTRAEVDAAARLPRRRAARRRAARTRRRRRWRRSRPSELYADATRDCDAAARRLRDTSRAPADHALHRLGDRHRGGWGLPGAAQHRGQAARPAAGVRDGSGCAGRHQGPRRRIDDGGTLRGDAAR